MDCKITLTDAAHVLKKSEEWVQQQLCDQQLRFRKSQYAVYFGHETARRLLKIPFTPRVIVFHVVKGGTGKTTLAYEVAVRSHLYGAKVLCVDLDQQGNLTQAFNQRAEDVPVMIDILADGYTLRDAVLSVMPGLDVLPSRLENALLDEVIRLKKWPLDTVYRQMVPALKQQYDVIILDCPPSLGQSVAAAALAADCVVAPVTVGKFAVSGLDMTCQSIMELTELYGVNIALNIVFNKVTVRSTAFQHTLQALSNDTRHRPRLLNSAVRLSQEFPNALARNASIFDVLKPTSAKADIDGLTQELLGIGAYAEAAVAAPVEAGRGEAARDSLSTIAVTQESDQTLMAVSNMSINE